MCYQRNWRAGESGDAQAAQGFEISKFYCATWSTSLSHKALPCLVELKIIFIFGSYAIEWRFISTAVLAGNYHHLA